MLHYGSIIKNKLPILLLIGFVLIGFYLRISGISTNHSFWTDEAHISNVARDMIAGEKGFLEAMQTLGVNYQPLHLIMVYISFLLLGISEFSARLPSVLLNTLGIIFAYLVATKISSYKAGVIAAFMMTFSQLNLANATQAKPYAILQTLFLIIFYLLTLLYEKPNSKRLHIFIIVTIVTASLFHYIGILFAIPYLLFVTYQYKREMITSFKSLWKLLAALLLVSVLSVIVNVSAMIDHLVAPVDGKAFLIYNNTTYLRDIFAHQYIFIALPAFFGILYLIFKKNVITLGFVLWMATLLFLWNFRYYSHNIRYLVPLFGVLFVYFAIFWDKAISALFKKHRFLLTLVLIAVLFLGGSKIVRKPSAYYSPNADFFADVQNANYKDAFVWINDNISDYKTVPIVNNLYETQEWYLGITPPVTFVKDYTFDIKPGGQAFHNITNNSIYTNLKSFLEYIENHPKGILIVEDWESILPEDIKQYAKESLQLEYRVESLDVSLTDKWPLEVYSWGVGERD